MSLTGPSISGAHHAVEIEDVIGKMIIAASADPTAVAMAAAVRRDDPQRLLSRSCQYRRRRGASCRLDRESRGPTPAVRIRCRLAPLEKVNRQAAGVDGFLARLAIMG